MRTTYQLTPEEFQEALDICNMEAPAIPFGSDQEKGVLAFAAKLKRKEAIESFWDRVGKRYGFWPDTVESIDDAVGTFSALPITEKRPPVISHGFTGLF